MKIPRDVSGDDLVKYLAQFGYIITRQTGSHLRLTTTRKGPEHHVTIPRHTPLKIGTLNSILRDVASYLEIERSDLAQKLFS